jgi:hypothetical protein
MSTALRVAGATWFCACLFAALVVEGSWLIALGLFGGCVAMVLAGGLDETARHEQRRRRWEEGDDPR